MSLSTLEESTLRDMAQVGRAGPSSVGTDAPRLEELGLVEFVKETRSGTTWYRLTEAGWELASNLGFVRKKAHKRD